MKFKILCHKGDAQFDYDTEIASIKFDELRGSGMLPMKISPDGNVPMRVFDPNAVEVMWVPAIAGG